MDGGGGLSEEILRLTLDSTFDAAFDTFDAAFDTLDAALDVGALDVVVTASFLRLLDAGVMLRFASCLGTFFHPHALQKCEYHIKK